MTVVTGCAPKEEQVISKLEVHVEDVELGLDKKKREFKDKKPSKPKVRVPQALKKVDGGTICLAIIWSLMAILVIYIIVSYILAPASTDHQVHLTAVNGSYGIVLEGRIVREILPGGAADQQGELKKGDEIMEIDGNTVTDKHHNKPEWILRYFKDSDGEVDLLVRNVLLTV